MYSTFTTDRHKEAVIVLSTLYQAIYVPNLAREHFYPARERGLGNEILPTSNEKVNNLQGAVLSDETRCPFLNFRLLTIRYLI